MRLTILLTLVMNLSALVLAVTLYAITREQDRDLAMLGLTCRVAEGIAGMDVSGRSAFYGSRRQPTLLRSMRTERRRSAHSS